MSHSDEPVICPNCQYPAVKNYCAQCGQETHLHNETFMGLVAHFAGHYFHYDSKFWQTLKALWFNPGKLTLAYWNKQRMRYIPPISLYIFISAVYFLLNFSFLEHKKGEHAPLVTDKKLKTEVTFNTKAADIALEAPTPENDSLASHAAQNDEDYSRINAFVERKKKEIRAKHGDVAKYMNELLLHNIPKAFFFMIPLMALILKVLFLRRKELYFVNHAIFSLHYHALWFSVFAIAKVNPIDYINELLYAVSFFAVTWYLAVALRRVYKIGWFQAAFYTFSIGFLYLIFLLLVAIAGILLMLLVA